ncbi:3-oxoacyl-ACP reductase [Rothia sp. AR01]|uniref:3-oxoacyl-ACP reductase n=1 Tax=Rothia santali TaxID=2949643 RepID=A0A9X2KH68_9MICC|nr:3-oxoacyl-ACP reductase [Rothia santali]MCP3424540.1 3-oxoacyl-ACP reductase [Rothia santali]
MTDSYARLINTPVGARAARALGLPRPSELRRYRPGADALPGREVLVLGDAGTDSLAAGLLARGCSVYRHPEPRAAYAAVVADFTAAQDPADLQRTALDLGHALKGLAAHGRIVVLGRPGAPEDEPGLAAARAGVVGLMRSVAHEVRRGATCNALLLADGVEPGSDDAAGPLAFLLSTRSAYVNGQPLTVRAGGASRPTPTGPRGPDRRGDRGGAGIGAAIVRRLSRDGARVLLVDVPAAGEALAAVANEVGGVALQLDITAADAGRRIAEVAGARLGPIDVFVHNAGITRDKLLANMDEARWASVIAVNLSAQLAINRQLLESGELGAAPRFVSLASTSGIAGNRGQSNYAASKAGIIGMVAAEAERFAAAGGTVNAVAPGFIETEMTRAMPAVTREVARRLNSLQQGGVPDDVAQAVGFLASDAAGGVTGQTLRVCGQSMVGA